VISPKKVLHKAIVCSICEAALDSCTNGYLTAKGKEIDRKHEDILQDRAWNKGYNDCAGNVKDPVKRCGEKAACI
jgi:hypothetical protein